MVTIRKVETGADLDRFVKLPFRLYRNDPNWVPPLIGDLKRTLTPGKNPFWDHADRELYLALRDGRVVGRTAAILDRSYNSHHDTRVGCFGFFELEDDVEVAQALFAAVKAFARARGADMVYGPANPSLNDEVALHHSLAGFKDLYDAGRLAIVQGVVHRHGGAIELKNREDRGGLRATVRLPISP